MTSRQFVEMFRPLQLSSLMLLILAVVITSSSEAAAAAAAGGTNDFAMPGTTVI